MKLSITRCRQLLGDYAEDLSDAEVETIRNTLQEVADYLVESYLSQSE